MQSVLESTSSATAAVKEDALPDAATDIALETKKDSEHSSTVNEATSDDDHEQSAQSSDDAATSDDQQPQSKEKVDDSVHPTVAIVTTDADNAAAESTTSKATTSEPSWGAWQTCWDATSGAYYYWNSETNTTTWECPWAAAAAAPLPGSPPPLPDAAPPAEEEEEDEDAAIYAEFMAAGGGGGRGGAGASGAYSAQAHFNARTGKFQVDTTLNPERFTQSARMQRQCDVFFNYDAFVEQRGESGGKRSYQQQLTPKQLETAKRRRKEKKLANQRDWLINDD